MGGENGNSAILEKLEGVEKLFLEKFKNMQATIDGIHEQTKKTNGTVANHEKWLNENCSALSSLINQHRKEKDDYIKRVNNLVWKFGPILALAFLSGGYVFDNGKEIIKMLFSRM